MNESNYNKFINICVEFCNGESTVKEVTESLKCIIKTLNNQDVQSIITDILWFVDSMLSDTFTEKIKENFIVIIRLCEQSVGLNTSFLKDRLSAEILETLELINSRQQYSAKLVKAKTRLFYKQTKFNLFREANEGFSKLIVELVIFDARPTIMAEKIKSLVGYFDLDPNRVLDLILDVLELKLDKSIQFIELLRLLGADKDDISTLIDHKLATKTNESLYALIVTLVQHGALELLSIYEHLSPTDDAINDQYAKDMENAKNRRFSNIFLTKLKDNPCASTDESDDIKIDETDYSNNQKLKLCFYFLKSGQWQLAKTLLDILPPYFALRYRPLCKLMCNILHKMIEPIYRRCCALTAIFKSSRLSKYPDLIGCFEPVNEYNDFNKLAFEITNYMGPMLSADQILLTKFIRITQSYYSECKSKSRDQNSPINDTYQGFFNLLRNCLLPSLSLLSCEVSLAEEMWEAVKYLPYDLRYSLYVHWKQFSTDEHPRLIEEKRSIQSQIRFVLKRLSKDNVKQIGRQFGKLCHCNPGIVFNEVLPTVLMFSNLSMPVVETIKYLGNLSLDMLMFCIIEILSGERGKPADPLHSQWIPIMSTFVGLLVKRYQFDLVGIFQYVLNEIKEGKCCDLMIVKEILHKMTGIEVSEDMTLDQIDAMAGGDLLRQEASYSGQMRNVRKNSIKLKDMLSEHNLAIPFALMLSQERNLLVHRSSDDPLKMVGRLYDQYHDTMVQWTSFFSLYWSANEMTICCPPLGELFHDYKIDPDMAFSLSRSSFKYKVQETLDALTDIASEDEMELFSIASQDVIEDFVKTISPYFSQEIWDDFNSSFFTTFWLLQSSDLMVPDAAYRKQEICIKTLIKQTEQDSSLTTLKKQKEVDRCNAVIEKLREEAKQGHNHVKLVDHWLNSVKAKWFVKNRSGAAKAIVMTRFIELCVFPRVCYSSNDALFVANLIYKLHRMKTPAFSTLICLDRIFNDITLMISTCSENEAKRYGRFLDAILNIIMKWHSSEEVFNEECVSHPGFVTVFRKNTDGNNKADQLTYENYRHVLHKWHYRVTKSIVSCLESDNYVQIRNALIILEKVIGNYPRVHQFGQAIERRIELLRDKEKDKHPELHALSQSYYGHMIAKKSLWLQDKDFHQKEEAKKTPITKVSVTNGDVSSQDMSTSLPTNKDSSATVRRQSEEKESSIEAKRRKVEPNTVDSKVRLMKAAPVGKKH